MQWNEFNPSKGRYQKLPKPKQWVLVQLNNMQQGSPNPVVAGYIKFAAGDKDSPYFVTPGAIGIQTPVGAERVLRWCKLPKSFQWPE